MAAKAAAGTEQIISYPHQQPDKFFTCPVFYFPRKEFSMNKRAYHIPPRSAECQQCKSYRPDLGCQEISGIQLKAAINDGLVTYRDLLITIYPQSPTFGWKIQELAGTYLGSLWENTEHRARFHFHSNRLDSASI